MTKKDLLARLSLSSKDSGLLSRILKDLEREGKIARIQNNRYVHPQRLNLLSGAIQGHKKGFAFFIPEDPIHEDHYISMENMGGAMHGDRVLLRSFPRKKKKEGEVFSILERANQYVVGRLEKDKRAPFAYLIPDNSRLSSHIFIPGDRMNGAIHKQKVVVKITSWPTYNRSPEGQVVEILGFEEEPGVDIESVIRQLDLPRDFPSQVEEAARMAAAPLQESDYKDRWDLRDLYTFTVDGEDAKDFDDAISLTPKGENRWELGVHIADVSHYVTPGESIDIEAQKRGTSIYLLDRVIPMLPESLSNYICSLKEGEDRLAFTVLMTLEGIDVVECAINKSVIRVKERLTYKGVDAILKEEKSPLYETFAAMAQLSQQMKEKRMAKGSLDFNFPEVKIILDERGSPQDIERQEQGPSNSIIEEFMLLANQSVAQFILHQEVPSLYRVHERPPKEKIQDLNTFLGTFGYRVKPKRGQLHSKDLQSVLHRCQGKEEERPIQNMILRSLSQARYAAENVGHFGLSMDLYTHFTSPIRRYPDLVIHRILTFILEGRVDEDVKAQLKSLLPEVADEASKRERLAMEAEWEVEEIKKVEYMVKKKGEVFSGIISGVIGSGFFVELQNTVEGFVRISTLGDDYYIFNQQQMTLTGERRKRIYRLGDRVNVLVDRVNMEEKEIDFLLVEDGPKKKR